MSEINKNPEKTSEFDPEKCNGLLGKLLDAFQEYKPTGPEILVIYGNLGYVLGASIEGYTTKGPDIEEVKKKYYANPTVGTALMLQGILVTTWSQDHEEKTNKKGQ